MSVANNLHFIPLVSIHPGKIVTYSEPSRKLARYNPNRLLNFLSQKEREDLFVSEGNVNKSLVMSRVDNKQQGELSVNAKRKMMRAIDYLLFLAKPKTATHFKTKKKFTWSVNFITLTLPAKQVHSDNEIKKKCLDPFLLELKKYHGLVNYVWRAERQQNGNIHFHILGDQYIHWKLIRNRWNRICERLGYVSAFQKKYTYRTPNSTDVHSLSKVKNVKSYIAKYVTKKEKGNPIIGRIWGCSQNLSNLKGAQEIIDYEIGEELNIIAKSKDAKGYFDKYFSVFSFDPNFLFTKQFPRLQALFDDYLNKQFNFNRQTSLVI